MEQCIDYTIVSSFSRPLSPSSSISLRPIPLPAVLTCFLQARVHRTRKPGSSKPQLHARIAESNAARFGLVETNHLVVQYVPPIIVFVPFLFLSLGPRALIALSSTIYSTMKFSGSFCGKEFSGITARSPQDLYRIVAGPTTVPMEEVRCWTLMDTFVAEETVWVEIQLMVPGFLEKMYDLLPDAVTIVFKKKPCSAPETSRPHNSPGKDDSRLLTVQQSLLESGLVEVSTSSSSGDISSGGALSPRGYGASNISNEVDPFTLKKVETIQDPLLLHFHKRLSVEIETICVDLSGFEHFVRSESDSGKNLFNLELKGIRCKNGQQRNFIVSKQVWARSILKHSETLPDSFTRYFCCAILREDQLDEMKREKDFWKRTMFWISDFLSFEESQHRLTMPPADGVSQWMSPFYFSAEEAQYAGSLMMPNTTTLQDTLKNMMEGKARAGAMEVCASHDLAPIFTTAFATPRAFHKDPSFKKEKKIWIKKREKEMTKK